MPPPHNLERETDRDALLLPRRLARRPSSEADGLRAPLDSTASLALLELGADFWRRALAVDTIALLEELRGAPRALVDAHPGDFVVVREAVRVAALASTHAVRRAVGGAAFHARGPRRAAYD